MVGPDQRDRQPQEPQLKQPEVAKHVHDIIEYVKKGLKRTPQYVDAAVDTILYSRGDIVFYEMDEGKREFDVHFSTKREYGIAPTNPDKVIERKRVEGIVFEASTTTDEGEIKTWKMSGESEYRDGQPEGGFILINNKGENTATSVNAAWNFFRAEYPEPQPQTPLPPSAPRTWNPMDFRA